MSKLDLPIGIPHTEADDFDEAAIGRASAPPKPSPAPSPLETDAGLQHKRFIALMTAALENPSGVRIKRDSHGAAVSLRHRLYRARRWYRQAGFSSLEKLVIRIETKGFSTYVYILPETPLEIELL